MGCFCRCVVPLAGKIPPGFSRSTLLSGLSPDVRTDARADRRRSRLHARPCAFSDGHARDAAGKHVFGKPMAQNVYECRLLEATARACKTVTQMGNQGHSGAGTIEFGRWVEAGLVKNVRRIDAWMTNSRRWHGWTDTAYPEAVPPIGYDWDLWLCRRPFRPYSEKLIDGNWRCWYEFGCGAMGDWGAHILDAVHRYLKLGARMKSPLIDRPQRPDLPAGSVITFKFRNAAKCPRSN